MVTINGGIETTKGNIQNVIIKNLSQHSAPSASRAVIERIYLRCTEVTLATCITLAL
jgi:hypothetical protein